MAAHGRRQRRARCAPNALPSSLSSTTGATFRSICSDQYRLYLLTAVKSSRKDRSSAPRIQPPARKRRAIVAGVSQTLRLARALLALLLAAVAGCASGPAPTSGRGGYQHAQRYIVAVLDVENRTGDADADAAVQRATGILIEELLGSERVRVVEREKLSLVLEELKLGVSGLVDARQAKRVGNLLGVDALMYAALESANHVDNKKSAGIAYSLKRKTEVSMSARLVHVETGEILASAQVSDKVTQRKSVAFGFITSGSLPAESVALQSAVEDATRHLARDLAVRVPRKS